MSEDMSIVYQSGEIVPETGTYEVVGVEQTVTAGNHGAVRYFAKGEILPDYEGRAVQWHLRSESEATATAGNANR